MIYPGRILAEKPTQVSTWAASICQLTPTVWGYTTEAQQWYPLIREL